MARYDCVPVTAPRGQRRGDRGDVGADGGGGAGVAEPVQHLRAGRRARRAQLRRSRRAAPSRPPSCLTESAMPTTVSRALPAAPVIGELRAQRHRDAVAGLGSLASTIWPGRSAQCPDCRVRSSTGPPGAARPASVHRPPRDRRSPFGPDCFGVTVTSANGPAAAVTPGSRPVAASSAAVARAGSTTAITCAPCWAANAWSNGVLESATSARASTQAPVDTSSTRPITMVCTRRRASPPAAARATGPALMAAPAPRPARCRRRGRPGPR